MYRATEISWDWDKALTSVKHGDELSVDIDWGFTIQDLFVLGSLHEINRHRKKIEELLTDCNFHTECGLLHEHNYKKFKESLFS